MSFADFSAQMKKKRGSKDEVEEEVRDFEAIHELRTRMLGVLIRDAREASGTTQVETSNELGIDEELLRSWEYGREAPTLPQLEMLAYFFDVPLSQFWSDKTLDQAQRERNIPVPKDQYGSIRNNMISALLKLARQDRKLSQEELALRSGQTPEQINAYEAGTEIPFPVLSSLASAVNKNMSYFLEGTGRIGAWLQMQEEYRRFAELPPEIRAFVSLHVNQPYIDIAMRLAKMPLGELRTVAEKILDITL
jgi:transcriptional regulator with XRE-family HTH domain